MSVCFRYSQERTFQSLFPEIGFPEWQCRVHVFTFGYTAKLIAVRRLHRHIDALRVALSDRRCPLGEVVHGERPQADTLKFGS